eukprot:6473378-Amphidinium_carterae.1
MPHLVQTCFDFFERSCDKEEFSGRTVGIQPFDCPCTVDCMLRLCPLAATPERASMPGLHKLHFTILKSMDSISEAVCNICYL